jgi:predicted GIY-YIG superfamily endonuclease
MTQPLCLCEERSAEAVSVTTDSMSEQYYICIMTDSHNTVLYVGVTNDLMRRAYEHRGSWLPDSGRSTAFSNFYIMKFSMT